MVCIVYTVNFVCLSVRFCYVFDVCVSCVCFDCCVCDDCCSVVPDGVVFVCVLFMKYGVFACVVCL